MHKLSSVQDTFSCNVFNDYDNDLRLDGCTNLSMDILLIRDSVSVLKPVQQCKFKEVLIKWVWLRQNSKI